MASIKDLTQKVRDTEKHYELILPSTGKKISFKAFTTAEEKLLHLAMDMDDDEGQIKTLKQILANCIDTPLDVDKLPVFDVDYIWLQLRCKSVEDKVFVPFECTNILDDGNKCGNILKVELDLSSIKIKKFPENNPKIEIDETSGIILDYPNFALASKLRKYIGKDVSVEKEDIENINADTNAVENIFTVIMESIKMVYIGAETFDRSSIDSKELEELLMAIPGKKFREIINFFETLPVLTHSLEFRCPKCKHQANITLEGTKTFLSTDSPTQLQ